MSIESSKIDLVKLKNDIELMQIEIENLVKKFSYIDKTVNSDIGSSGGEGGSGSTSNDNWNVLYDKESLDEYVNLNRTGGIFGSSRIIAELPDLDPYSFIKIQFYAAGSKKDFIYDISNKEDNGIYIMMNNITTTILYGFGITLTYANGKRILDFGNCTRVNFYSTKYTGITNLQSDKTVYICKISAK